MPPRLCYRLVVCGDLAPWSPNWSLPPALVWSRLPPSRWVPTTTPIRGPTEPSLWGLKSISQDGEPPCPAPPCPQLPRQVTKDQWASHEIAIDLFALFREARAGINKPMKEWLCNYCAMGESRLGYFCHFWDTFVNYYAMCESRLGYFCAMGESVLWHFCQRFIWICKHKLKDKHTQRLLIKYHGKLKQNHNLLGYSALCKFRLFWVLSPTFLRPNITNTIWKRS